MKTTGKIWQHEADRYWVLQVGDDASFFSSEEDARRYAEQHGIAIVATP